MPTGQGFDLHSSPAQTSGHELEELKDQLIFEENDAPELMLLELTEELPEELPEELAEDLLEELPEELTEDFAEELPDEFAEEFPDELLEEPALLDCDELEDGKNEQYAQLSRGSMKQ